MIPMPHDSAAVNHRVVERPMLALETPSHADAVAPPVPSEEQVRAIDGAFIHQQHEQDTIASIIGLRLSVMLMHDLAKDAIPTAEEEEQPEKLLLDDGDQPAD
jgi:hypothetical protein